MFNSVFGIVSAKGAETVYIICGNIEWEVTMPANDIHELALNKEHRILTWLYHREDQMKLFGFFSEKRRNTFIELLKVEGIGPKGAVKIMGGIGQDDLEKALETGDLTRLEAVPGLGRKTAQKMLLSLKGKLIQPQTAGAVSVYNDLIEALVGMGYDRRLASDALIKAVSGFSRTADLTAAEKEKQIFQEAIVYLSAQ